MDFLKYEVRFSSHLQEFVQLEWQRSGSAGRSGRIGTSILLQFPLIGTSGDFNEDSMPRDFFFSFALYTGGVAWGAFSLYLIVVGPEYRQPAGSDYFTVFAQLAATSRNVDSQPPAGSATPGGNADMLPVGSIRRPPEMPAAAASVAAERVSNRDTPASAGTLDGMTVIQVVGDAVLFNSPNGQRLLFPGDVLPGGAKFMGVTFEAGGWRVMTDLGPVPSVSEGPNQ